MKQNFCVSCVLISIIFSFELHGNLYNYIYPHQKSSFSNYGGVGLIQNPTSRFLQEGTLALSWSHNEPYLRGSLVAYPFNWLEASYQYTDINNALYSDSPDFSGSQSLKDKSFDVKLKLLNETRLLPQIAVGVRDIGGTGLFGSEYLVANKFLRNNIDLTFGIGWGNLNRNSISNPLINLSDTFKNRNSDIGQGGTINFKNLFSGEAGYFAGIEIYFPYLNGLRGKIELDGTNYVTESRFPLIQDNKINLGLVYPINNEFDIKLSYVRGNTLNFGFSYAPNFGPKNPRNIKKEKKLQVFRPDIVKTITAKSDENIYKASLLYLGKEQINLQKATIVDEQLHVVYAQAKFRSPALAAGRAINILHDSSPDKIKSIKVSEINGGMGIYSLSIDRDILERYKRFNSPSLVNHYSESDGFIFNEEEYAYNPESSYPALFYSIGPDIRSQIGGPDGFFFGDLKLTFNSEILFSRDISLLSNINYGLYDNMDELKLSSNSILPHVRTEIVQYLKQSRNLSITRMQLNHYGKFSKSLFYKFSGGILETMFNGIGFEVLYRPYFKNFGIGLEAWKVYQRDFDQKFNTLAYQTLTGHLSFYYKEQNTGILFQLKGGRYLARDSGFTFDFSREFASGFRVGAFFSLTDISDIEFGEGSFDKGFYFFIPIDVFSEKYQSRNFGWGLRPITRDGAATINHGYPLWGVTDRASN